MADSLGDVIINLRSRDVNMKSGLDGIRHELEHLSSHIFSFGGLLHIAFGAAASRAIFHEIHHALKDFGEGFIEAQKHGDDFYGSLNEGVNKIIGLKTAFEQAAAASKELAESNEKVQKSVDAIDKITGQHKKDEQYQNLKEGDNESAEKAIADLKAERDKAGAEVTAAIKKADENEKARTARTTQGPMAGVIKNDPAQIALRESQRQEDQTAITAARARETELDSKIKAKQDELGHADAKAGAEKIKAEAKNVWSNLAGTFQEVWKPVHEAIEKTGKALHKEGVQGAKHDAEKNLQHKMQELDRFIESEMQKQAKAEEQEKHDDESAKRIKDASDPLAKLKDEMAEISRLFGIGKLSPEEARKAREKDAKEFSAQNHRDNQVQFRSADAAADDMLKKSLEEASMQKEANDLLKKIETNTSKPQPAAMI